MPFDESNIGDPFHGDFSDIDDSGGELAAAAARQAADLSQISSDVALSHHLLRALRQRRLLSAAAPAELSSDMAAVTQFGVLPGEEGSHHLHVTGELLITGQSYDGRHAPFPGGGEDQYAKPYLDKLGMRAEEIDECPALQRRVLRLVNPDMDPDDFPNLAKALRARRFVASLTAIHPTAPVMKGLGGPYPAPSPGSFQPDNGPGEPAMVAIIDTGVAGLHRGDGWMQGVRGDDDPLDVFPPPNGDGYLDTDAGHGTFVAGIVRQVAPGAQIRVYRAVDSDGIASEIAVACAMIQAVTRDGAQIINLSLGCHTQDNVPPIAIAAALEIIANWEREHNTEVVIVAAAGNYGNSVPCWPAAFPRVVSVAALTRGLHPAAWSTCGFWVRCSTLGQGLRSTYVEGQESPLMYSSPQVFGPNSWAVWSGTSFAAAQVTGALARLREKDGFDTGDALRRLLGAGRPIPQFGQALRILPGF